MVSHMWKRTVENRPFFVLNVVDWVVGAAGFDGKVLGWAMHPAISISLLAVSSLLIFEHLRDKYKSGRMYGGELCSLKLPTPPRTLSPKHRTSVESTLKADPPEVKPRGGEDFTLEFRASFSAAHYGYGWLSGPGVTRQKPFDLRWKGEQYIQEGDVAIIEIAELEQPYSRGLRMWDIHSDPIHKDESWGRRLHSSGPTEWLELRVEIRAHGVKGAWTHHYRFRLRGRDEFEVVGVQMVKGVLS